MDSLLRFLVKYEVLLYFLIGVIVVISLRRVMVAWKSWRTALFGIEKEKAQYSFNQGITILILSGLLGMGLFIITTFVAPSVPNLQQVPTPTVDLTAQPTGTVVSATETPVATTGLIPTLESVFNRGCVPDQIDWTNPVDGDTISGTVTLTGTVNVTDLGYYRYDYAADQSDTWTTLAAGSSKIINQPLGSSADQQSGGSWDTSVLTPGKYKLRLAVFDHQNTAFNECIITVTIVSPS